LKELQYLCICRLQYIYIINTVIIITYYLIDGMTIILSWSTYKYPIPINTPLLVSAGTNLKVGGTGPERKWGHQSGAKRRKKIFWSCPPLFGSKSTISHFGERFRDGTYILVSISCLLFLYSRCPPCQAICKSGGTCLPRAPWSRHHWPLPSPKSS